MGNTTPRSQRLSWSLLVVDSCVFSHCTVLSPGGSVNGGAVRASGGDLVLTGCRFEGCSVYTQSYSARGGVLSIHDNVTAVMHDCVVINSASSADTDASNARGGAIDTRVGGWSTLTVTSSTFTNCRASGGGSITAVKGGAFFVDEDNVLIVAGCSFVDCSAVGTHELVRGGAIDVDGVGSSLSDCTFERCAASAEQNWAAAGAIYVSTATVAISGCRFHICTTFSRDSWAVGGAVSVYVGRITFHSCTFDDCGAVSEASTAGGGAMGGFYSNTVGTGSALLNGCTLASCYATTTGASSAAFGGIIMLDGGSIQMENATSLTNGTVSSASGSALGALTYIAGGGRLVLPPRPPRTMGARHQLRDHVQPMPRARL